MKKIESYLARIANSLERLSPNPGSDPDFSRSEAFVWSGDSRRLEPVQDVNRIDISLLVGIDRARDTLLENTSNFAQGYHANNALLWGARGMGKSSLVKSVHGSIFNDYPCLKLVEIHRDDLSTIGSLLWHLRCSSAHRIILYCDDLSFSHDDSHYKSLKAVLDGGVEGRPANVVFYATSNRRHLMPRDMIENERSTAINPSEAVDEKVSLSDRFGLWLGFHPCSQNDYLEMVLRYCKRYGVEFDEEWLQSQAIEWQQTRGARSGRVAWQFFVDLAGKQGISP
ncbi:MAG: ATP-binding protein [Albidovulum sp.]|nr:ATP-binding protein [Albidovulum sp.]MDE0307126.1 ATP-binding protein [Albidovulum sp.]MDE0531726.1 ATP-binding protein [Albidovulum sp.]